MKVWWEARTRREQALLAVLGVATLAVVLWVGGHRPVDVARRLAEQRYERALTEQIAVTRAATRIQVLQASAPASSAKVHAAEAVNASAKAAGLALSRVEPDPEGGVQVAVEGVSPGALFPWLASLQRNYGVTPRHLTVIKDERGALSVDATLAEAG